MHVLRNDRGTLANDAGRLPLRPQIAPDQPGVRLTDFDEPLGQ